MTEDQVRQEFEEWYKNTHDQHCLFTKSTTRTYGDSFLNATWEVFKAATELAEKRHAEEIARLQYELEYWRSL